jgi:hypothetical protein
MNELTGHGAFDMIDETEELSPMFDKDIMAEVEALHGSYCPICGSGDDKEDIKLCLKCFEKLSV